MEGYEKDLRSGAREALLDRYDRRGAYFLGGGEKEFLPFDSIGAIYRSRWTPPGSFEWRDLSFEVVGPGAVVVTGQFLWGERTGAVLPFSYTALLIRQNGELRIRVEDESVAPEALKATLCRPDSSAM